MSGVGGGEQHDARAVLGNFFSEAEAWRLGTKEEQRDGSRTSHRDDARGEQGGITEISAMDRLQKFTGCREGLCWFSKRY